MNLHTIIVFCILLKTVNGFINECFNDSHCARGEFCLDGIFRCSPCLDCSYINRVNTVECPRQLIECGDCLKGYFTTPGLRAGAFSRRPCHGDTGIPVEITKFFCSSDFQCFQHQYCQGGLCKDCIDCKKLHMYNPKSKFCVKTREECGPCLPGFEEKRPANNRGSNYCALAPSYFDRVAKRCNKDKKCPRGEFCSGSRCIACLNCSAINRENTKICHYDLADCGKCLEGYNVVRRGKNKNISKQCMKKEKKNPCKRDKHCPVDEYCEKKKCEPCMNCNRFYMGSTPRCAKTTNGCGPCFTGYREVFNQDKKRPRLCMINGQ